VRVTSVKFLMPVCPKIYPVLNPVVIGDESQSVLITLSSSMLSSVLNGAEAFTRTTTVNWALQLTSTSLRLQQTYETSQ
jgi:hypothetical protein